MTAWASDLKGFWMEKQNKQLLRNKFSAILAGGGVPRSAVHVLMQNNKPRQLLTLQEAAAWRTHTVTCYYSNLSTIILDKLLWI